LSASVQILPLNAGLYLFSVTSGATHPESPNGTLRLPAMHVGLGPGVKGDQVEFVAGPSTVGAWLFAKDDCLVTKISGSALLIMTSIRGSGGETLSIKVERLDGRVEAPSVPAVAPVPAAVTKGLGARKAKTLNGAASSGAAAPKLVAAPPAPGKGEDTFGVEIGAHIRTRGDQVFKDLPWAGRIAPGLWIESFSIKPPPPFSAADLEYKSLTGSGFETPWLSDAAMCGTRGMSVPLVGFAIRLRPGKHSSDYDCEYSGYFKSGVTIGPLRNGTPCRSNVANDPLEGIQVLLRRRARGGSGPARATPAGTRPAALARPRLPSFGPYRDVKAVTLVAPKVEAATPAASKVKARKRTAKKIAKQRPARR